MSQIRLELTGKDSDAWNRIFEKLTDAVARAVDQLAPEDHKESANELAQDIAEITKTWVKAKLQKSSLENEKLISDITKGFEEAKLIKANRESVEIDNEKKRLDLWEQRLVSALKWLGFIQNHVAKDDEGNVVLLMTNSDMASLLIDVRSTSVG